MTALSIWWKIWAENKNGSGMNSVDANSWKVGDGLQGQDGGSYCQEKLVMVGQHLITVASELLRFQK